MKLEPYISQEQIGAKVSELAEQIQQFIGEDEAILIANLKGSVVFLADLIRRLESQRIKLDFISTESYRGKEHTGAVKITRDLSLDVTGKKVVLIEDILDTGLTLNHIIRYLRDIHAPSQIKVCVLLDKPNNRKVEVKADYVGFEIDNQYVVGYGLDYCENLRNLPYIAIIPRENMNKCH